ncbi:hypothetical protein [Peribacillus kribbensis]|uniref:hypothetical protein n=1 Tax=Peribacillus kribbensis TaxID=356658 RepID=UPI0004252085|nr:hypothetical protein [Peribacillus kribbensis]
MRSLQDALYNWLSIKVVCDARPEDTAAQETQQLFHAMLVEDHNISSIEISREEPMYYLTYDKDGETHKTRFPIELIDAMLNQIEQEPERYKNFS